MKTFLKVYLCLAVLLTGCLSTSVLSAQTAYNMTVKAGGQRQTFNGFGASAWSRYWKDFTPVPRNTMADMVFRDLKANTVRLWVTTGDGITVSQMLAEFKDQYLVNDSGVLDPAHNAISDIKSRGVTTLLLAPYDYRLSPHEPVSISSYASNLAEFILQLKNTYGITIQVTGLFNEPEVLWTTTHIVDGIGYLRSALDSRGLTSVQIIAPESFNHGTAAITTASLAANATDWNGIMGIASHSYAMLEDEKLNQLRNGKPWWVTEAGDGTQSEVGMEDDSRGSTIAGRFLSETNNGASEWIYQIGIGEDTNVATDNLDTAYLTEYDQHTSSIVTFLKYYYLKQALNTIDPGAIFRKCTSSTEGGMFLKQVINYSSWVSYYQNPAISAAAAYNPDGSWGINVVNQTGISAPVATSDNQFYAATTYNVTITVEELLGTPNKSFAIYRTKSGTHFVNSGSINFVNGVATLALGAKEMVSLRSAPTAAAIPPVPNGLVATTYSAPITLNWNNTVKATSWKVKRATNSGGPYTIIATPTTTCYKDSSAVAGTVYYYVVSAVNASGESANSSEINSSPTPNPWMNTDINRSGSEVTGSYQISDNGTFTVKCGGTYFANYATDLDKFNFTYRTMTGDGTIIAHLASGSYIGSAYGVMMRETLASTSKATGVFWDYTSWTRTLFWNRATAGSGAGSSAVSPVLSPPWFKLVRAGNVFSGYSSADGLTWTPAGSATVPMNATIYVGLSSASSDPAAYTEGIYDNVSVQCAAPTGLTEIASAGQVRLVWTASLGAASYNIKRATSSGGPYTTLANVSASVLGYTDSTVVSGTNYYYAVSAVNGMGESANSTQLKAWLNNDVGTAGLAGNCLGDANYTWTTCAGTYAGYYSGSPDSYNYTYRSMTGDGTLIARLSGGTHAMSSYGLLMRETLSPTAKAVGIYYDYNTPYQGTWMFTRTTSGAGTNHYSTASTAPTWFKLVRSGNIFSGYSSTNGTSWTPLNSTTIPMASTIFIGLSSASGNTAEYGYGTFDNVTAP